MQKSDEIKFELNNATTVKWVAWMSFLWSMASLMVVSVLPAFLVDELKMGHSHIGIVEGLAISSSFLAKFFSGYLSDIFKTRKPLIMIGTIMSALTKPLFAVCNSAGLMFGLRFSDRLIKGIRSAPTEALIADLSEFKDYASNFGLRQALYTSGAVAGALTATIIMLLSNNNCRLVFALSFIPAFMAIMVLWFLIKPNPKTHPRASNQFKFKKISFSDLKSFSSPFWWLMLATFFLMLARFSETFLSLKAKEVGWSIALLPAVIVIMDIVHAGIAWPAGKYADRLSRKQMFALGIFIQIAAQVVLSYVNTAIGVFVGLLLVGLYMGITQGLIRALIAESVPPELRGTAFSIFWMIMGFAIFLSNAIAGSLSETFGLYATFITASGFTGISMIVLHVAYEREKVKTADVLGNAAIR